MHERSLVQSLLNQIEALRREHNAQSISSVTVEIGILSGVESDLVETAFAELSESTLFSIPSLVVRKAPLKLKCRSCDRESFCEDIRFLCDHCESNQVTVSGGDAFRLLDVELVLDEPTVNC